MRFATGGYHFPRCAIARRGKLLPVVMPILSATMVLLLILASSTQAAVPPASAKKDIALI